MQYGIYSPQGKFDSMESHLGFMPFGLFSNKEPFVMFFFAVSIMAHAQLGKFAIFAVCL